MNQQRRDDSGKFVRRDRIASTGARCDRAVRQGEAAIAAYERGEPGATQDLRAATTLLRRTLREVDELIFEVEAA